MDSLSLSVLNGFLVKKIYFRYAVITSYSIHYTKLYEIDLKVKNTWYKLDNAGKLYPAIAGVRMSTVFRLSVVLNRTVDQIVLQNALDSVIERFSYFKVNLRRGIFWYYFEYTKKNPKVEKETYYPCMFLNYKKKGRITSYNVCYTKLLRIGKINTIRDGGDVTIAATGMLVAEAMEAAKKLKEEGISARVLNVGTIKPLDKDAILKAAKETKFILTAEEHSVIGGLGSAVSRITSYNVCYTKLLRKMISKKR